MSILTKFFVIVVAVLSVLLVALVVPFVAKTEDYKSRVVEAEQKEKVANQKALAAQNNIDYVLRQQQERDRSKDAEFEALKNELRDERERLNAMADKIKELESKLQDAAIEVSTALAAAQQTATIAQDAQVELNARRRENTKNQQRLIELGQISDDYRTQIDTLSRNVAQAKEVQVELESRLREYEDIITQAGISTTKKDDDAEGKIGDPPVAVYGTITGMQDMLNQKMVQINIGSNDLLKPDMRLFVHRDNGYVARIVTVKVEANASVARVVSVSDGDTIRVGDSVLGGPPTTN